MRRECEAVEQRTQTGADGPPATKEGQTADAKHEEARRKTPGHPGLRRSWPRGHTGSSCSS